MGSGRREPAAGPAATAVTNHGFENGRTNPINSVLQAGTAVLVDDKGEPRVRCKCGNPLLEGKQFSRSSYTGQQWSGFDTTRITVIQPIHSPIDAATGSTFTDSRGSPTGSATTAG